MLFFINIKELAMLLFEIFKRKLKYSNLAIKRVKYGVQEVVVFFIWVSLWTPTGTNFIFTENLIMLQRQPFFITYSISFHNVPKLIEDFLE